MMRKLLWPLLVAHYSIKNAIFYRKPRNIVDIKPLQDSSGIDEIRKQMTVALLVTAGLKLNGHSTFLVYLTPYQRRIAALVKPYGFNVGL